MMNRAVLLWASSKLPGLLDSERQKTIITEIMNEQQSDGGWVLASHAWPGGWSLHSMVRERLRSDWSRQNAESDGYATGLVTYVLQEVGISCQDSKLKQGLSWLSRNQSEDDGSWSSSSLTKRRNPSSNVGHFMRDAATAYAVLALSENGRVSAHDSDAGNLSTHSSATASAPRVAGATHGN